MNELKYKLRQVKRRSQIIAFTESGKLTPVTEQRNKQLTHTDGMTPRWLSTKRH